MKRRFFSLIFILTSTITFAGNYFSTPEQEEVRIKIASKDVLKLRADLKLLSTDFLEKTKFLELFADQEIIIKELDAQFTTMSNNLWAEVKKGITEEQGTIQFLALYPLISKELNKEMANVKPIILEILLKEDSPDIYKQLSEIKE